MRYIYDGVQVDRPGKSLDYSLVLDYDEYKKTEDIRPILARDMLKSLETIKSVKKIQDFDVEKFKDDFEFFFKQNLWI
ncbi:hypothetical protein [Chitinophaga rhizophila]|uniref:Uncharacterized protein n=1 Tax=Chitinophaga rhizophila TaxID=2866212 RepID=A0ABS7GKS8_9BACT|nr:hypothetical protein [Chitinophaga rhizophila]MBW8687242.1 hypothetical protein [Chitinophaga rhizophila]